MPAEFLAVGAELLSWVATYLLHSSCLMGSVWLFLRLRTGTGPVVREILWKAALVGGIVTTPAQMLMSHSSSGGTWVVRVPVGGRSVQSPNVVRSDAVPLLIDLERSDGTPFATDDLFVERAGRDDWPVMELDLEPQAVEYRLPADILAGTVDHRAEGAARQAAPEAPRYEGWLLGAPLLAGGLLFAIGLCRYLWQSVALRRRLTGARRIDDGPARLLLDELCRTVPRVPPVRLLSAPHCSEPAAFGLRRWTIVLPAQAERDLSTDEMRSLLAHELAHLVRGDMWWLLVSRLVCSCGGFQPLNHLARREWQRAAEYLCDAWAVSRTGNPLALARCLTEVASWRLSQPDCAASLAATGSRSGLADRIECLVDGRPPAEPATARRTRRRLVAAAAVVLAGLIGSGLRVDLSIAAPHAASTAVAANEVERSEPARGMSGRLGRLVADGGAAAGARAADGGDASATLAEAVPATPITAETRTLYEALDEELRGLQRDLTELQPLLEQPHVPAGARGLAEFLQREMTRLEERRVMLNHALSQSRGERGASGPERQRDRETERQRDRVRE